MTDSFYVKWATPTRSSKKDGSVNKDRHFLDLLQMKGDRDLILIFGRFCLIPISSDCKADREHFSVLENKALSIQQNLSGMEYSLF